jgi:hypothetical protein
MVKIAQYRCGSGRPSACSTRVDDILFWKLAFAISSGGWLLRFFPAI